MVRKMLWVKIFSSVPGRRAKQFSAAARKYTYFFQL
jgi:hypothetical protein